MSMARAKFMLCFVAVTLWIPLSFASTTTNQNKDQKPYIDITDTQVLKLTCGVPHLNAWYFIEKLEVTFRSVNDDHNNPIASILSSKDINKSELYPWVEVKGYLNKTKPEDCYLQLTFPRNDTFTGNFTCHVSYDGGINSLQNVKEISVGKGPIKPTKDSFRVEIFPVHMATITWNSLKVKEIRVYRCVMDRTGNSFKDISLFVKNDRDNHYQSSLVILINNKSLSTSEKLEYEWNLYIERDAHDTRNYNYSAEITTQGTPCFEQELDVKEREQNYNYSAEITTQGTPCFEQELDVKEREHNNTSITIGLSVGMLLTFLFGMLAGALLMYCLKVRNQNSPQAGNQNGRQAGNQSGRQVGNQNGRQAGNQNGRQAGNQNSPQAGNQNGRQVGNQNGRQAGNQNSRQVGNQNGRQAGNQNSRQVGNQNGRQAGNQNGRQAGNQNGRQADNQNGRQAGNQNGRQTDSELDAPEELVNLIRTEAGECAENNEADNHHRLDRSASDIDIHHQ